MPGLSIFDAFDILQNGLSGFGLGLGHSLEQRHARAAQPAVPA